MPFLWEELKTLSPSEPLVATDEWFEARADAALQFLGSHLAQSGKNRNKPVMTHGMRVGAYLRRHGCCMETVIAGILHDVLESTQASPRVLETLFGEQVRQIVEANTVKKQKGHWYKRFQGSLKRCRVLGEKALLVRAADTLDNIRHHWQRDNQQKLDRLLEKLEDLHEALSPYDRSVPVRSIVKDIQAHMVLLHGRRQAGA